jgi:hypothetical protein
MCRLATLLSTASCQTLGKCLEFGPGPIDRAARRLPFGKPGQFFFHFALAFHFDVTYFCPDAIEYGWIIATHLFSTVTLPTFGQKFPERRILKTDQAMFHMAEIAIGPIRVCPSCEIPRR